MLALLKQHLKHFLLFELPYQLSQLTLIEQSSQLVLRSSCILSLRNCGLPVVGAPNYETLLKLVLGIGQENHNRLSEELNQLIIDCTIGFLFAVSNNIQKSLKEYRKPEHVCCWLYTDCQKCKVIISCQRCKVIQFTVKNHQ